MSTNFDRLREVFQAAVEQHPASQWDAYLDEACAGDAELRQQAALLLKAHAEGGSLVNAPLPDKDRTGLYQPVTERPGTVIGPYKLLQQIGEGGMGVVWMAEQTQPVQRKVALKVIKPGMDSRQVIARFEAERQALALMDHVNIARVFDGGTTEAGRPYFVMELVHGVPITKYCDDNHLTPRERLELFVPVCQAIQHAHQKGIIHRDIKPSNVMVTLYDGKPVPKVIDFGVAEATEQKLTERTLFTQYGTLVGTLEYMSPEQAEMSALGVDTRSDIYSLGVLLYELLTGSTPLTRKRMKEAAYAEILRMIKEEEPPRPSTRLSDSGETLASISANRHTEPAKLTKLVRGELDWIVMKALEKDRNRRYETASALAADVQRYLDDEPVQACPPSAWYRYRKFARRNKATFVTGTLVTLAVLTTVVALAFSNVRITQEKNEKELARQTAARNAERARDAVKKYFTVVSEDAELQAEGLEPLRRKLLATARDFYVQFVQDAREDPALRAELAEAHMRLGSITAELGENDEAIKEYQQALDLCRQLVKAEPAVSAYQGMLVKSHGSLGRLKHAIGNLQDAEAAYLEALAIGQRLVDAEPAAATHQHDLAVTYHGLGSVFKDTDRSQEAEAAYQKAADIWQRLLSEHSKSTQYQGALADNRSNLGVLLEAAHRFKEAEAAYGRALEIRRGLAKGRGDVPDCQHDLASSLLNLGAVYKATDRLEDAEEVYVEAQAIWQRLADLHPQVVKYPQHLAMSLNNLAGVYHSTNRLEKAKAAQKKALAIRQELAKNHGDVLELVVQLGGSQCNMGNLARDAGNLAPALDWYSQAITTLESALGREERHPTARLFLGKAHFGRGVVLHRQKRYADAENAYLEALRIQPDSGEVQCELARALQMQARFAQALPYFVRGHELLSPAAPMLPSTRFVGGRVVSSAG